MVVFEISFINHDCETYVLDTDATKNDLACYLEDSESIIAQRLFYSPGTNDFIENHKIGERKVIVNLQQAKTITILMED